MKNEIKNNMKSVMLTMFAYFRMVVVITSILAVIEREWLGAVLSWLMFAATTWGINWAYSSPDKEDIQNLTAILEMMQTTTKPEATKIEQLEQEIKDYADKLIKWKSRATIAENTSVDMLRDLVKLKGFWTDVAERMFEHWMELDGGTFQDLGTKHGLLVEMPHNQEKYGHHTDIAPGENIFYNVFALDDEDYAKHVRRKSPEVT